MLTISAATDMCVTIGPFCDSFVVFIQGLKKKTRDLFVSLRDRQVTIAHLLFSLIPPSLMQFSSLLLVFLFWKLLLDFFYILGSLHVCDTKKILVGTHFCGHHSCFCPSCFSSLTLCTHFILSHSHPDLIFSLKCVHNGQSRSGDGCGYDGKICRPRTCCVIAIYACHFGCLSHP